MDRNNSHYRWRLHIHTCLLQFLAATKNFPLPLADMDSIGWMASLAFSSASASFTIVATKPSVQEFKGFKIVLTSKENSLYLDASPGGYLVDPNALSLHGIVNGHPVKFIHVGLLLFFIHVKPITHWKAQVSCDVCQRVLIAKPTNGQLPRKLQFCQVYLFLVNLFYCFFLTG